MNITKTLNAILFIALIIFTSVFQTAAAQWTKVSSAPVDDLSDMILFDGNLYITSINSGVYKS